MSSGDFINLSRRTASDKLLRDDAFNIDKNPKYDGYQCELSAILKKTFSDANTSGGAILEHQQLAEEVHKPNNKKFEKKILKRIFGVLILRICN